MFLKILQFHRSLILKKLQFWGPATLLKKVPTQLFSCKFCDLFKNTCFKERLRTAGSKTLVRGFLVNKVASLMAWRPLTVLERDSSTGIFLQILCNFKESFFVGHLATFSYMMFLLLLLLLLLQINEVCSLQSICLVK